MDKNKSLNKLKGLPHILWLNLDRDTHRREYIESHFNYWNIENHIRISGYDAKESDVSLHLRGRYPDLMSQNEVGCVLSHLKAIKYFYEETDFPYILICEDDVDFNTAKYWNFTWKDFTSKMPYDWDCIQLSLICTGNIHVRIHHRFINNFSAACYLITRHHAEKIIKNHIRGDKYKLDNGVRPRAVSEDLIFESGKTYSIPLILYRLDLGSSIHPEHIDLFHKNSYEGILNFWKQNGSYVEIEDIMTYDPYLGKITDSQQSP